MRELVIISGKGGTGKTSLTAAFASLAENAVLCDADVDAADLHLIIPSRIQQRHDFQGGNQATINIGLCSGCGTCINLCRFDAITPDLYVDPMECEGCGVCVDFCPERVIDLHQKTCGEWYVSDTDYGPMVHARLGIAEENSGRLVSLVRQEAKRVLEENRRELLLTDGPPGIGCPVIASIGGATAVLIITEPTLSGAHDLKRVMELARHFSVPAMLCVNKYDINPEQTLALEDFAMENGVTVLERIPFDPMVTRAMVEGKTIFEYDAASPVSKTVRRIWEQIMTAPEMNRISELHFST